MFTAPEGGALVRNNFNVQAWKPALVAAGVLPLPSSESRTRKAVDGMYRAAGEGNDGPQAAQAA
ncbi:hypothetical protein OG352_12500 [Streptomyces sp. NBC_01485]|uniref:hypothetical protein n=1 Tax=Streptomyces sp. NBC_01485 TaxID=2903884 RepID=UPI002E34F5CB|nr:hypothetical protein [Streptomyces sp. NBC_01485]